MPFGDPECLAGELRQILSLIDRHGRSWRSERNSSQVVLATIGERFAATMAEIATPDLHAALTGDRQRAAR